MHTEASMEICAICLGSMKAGDGQALFTAECSHTFHFNCITSNVQHGNHICPTCRATWNRLPFQAPTPPPPPPSPFVFPPFLQVNPPSVPHPNPYPNTNSFNFTSFFQQARVSQPSLPVSLNFADDDPLASREDGSVPPPSQQGGGITVRALPEYPALSRLDQSDSFAVLVSIRAPPLSPEASDRPNARAPIDLVAVLDVSGSMSGDKIRLLKEAVRFVVDNLGPQDRLSIITFSTSAQRVTRLQRMTDPGRANTVQAVNSLYANGATNIVAGLRLATQVLEQRREKNPVASIILLSDGQDNQNGHGQEGFFRALSNLPSSIRSRALENPTTQNDAIPVHTFGFGSDHDATALHAIADGSGGTFSYIESIEIIQDAFAQCIGGLLSVVAQEVELEIRSSSPGVQIQSISSGRYRNTIDNDGRQHGVIYVGDLYAEEKKQFLVYLSIPKTDVSLTTTKLLEVKCSYKDPISNEAIISETHSVEIRRPLAEDLTEADRAVCQEVDQERHRVLVAEGIAEAQAMAERGALDEAHSFLGQQRMRLMTSPSAQAGSDFFGWLDGEVRGVQEGMASRELYFGGGRAYAFSKGSSHLNQRASTQAVSFSAPQSGSSLFGTAPPMAFGAAPPPMAFGAAPPMACGAAPPWASGAAPPPPAGMGYETNFMRKMVTKSQVLRQSTKQDEGGSSK